MLRCKYVHREIWYKYFRWWITLYHVLWEALLDNLQTSHFIFVHLMHKYHIRSDFILNMELVDNVLPHLELRELLHHENCQQHVRSVSPPVMPLVNIYQQCTGKLCISYTTEMYFELHIRYFCRQLFGQYMCNDLQQIILQKMKLLHLNYWKVLATKDEKVY